MGIDVYMHWTGMSVADKRAQMNCLFQEDSGHLGYLREAYHGGPYPSRALVPESFEERVLECHCEFAGYSPDDLYDINLRCDGHLGPRIDADLLVERLPKVLELAKERAEAIYKEDASDDNPAVKSYVDFVELAVRKQAETQTPVRIYASW